MENGNSPTYHTQDNLYSYTGRCTKSDPVPENIYDDMRQNGFWTGGWVGYTPNITYRTTDGTQYGSYYGSQDSPWPLSVYNEMSSNGIWSGGWIKESNEDVRYVQNFQVSTNAGSSSGCGSGSGSGSGCGSGSGSASGSGVSRPEDSGHPISSGNELAGTILDGVGVVRLNWTSGNTTGDIGLSMINTYISFRNSSSST